MRQKICYFFLFRLLGWSVIGEPPIEKKIVLTGLPHTSNWDFVIAWIAVTGLGLDMKFFTKDSFHIWPLNYVTHFFGALPVNRRKSTNFVETVAQMYRDADTLLATIAPEGTRKFSPKLKSGYYYIAKIAEVQIVVAGPDYKNKSFTFMPAREPMATFEKDEQNLIEFCKKLTGKYPDNSFR